MASIILSVNEWIDSAKSMIVHVQTRGDLPNKHNAAYRWSCYVLGIPIMCSPCFVWSTLWRIIACPGMCICKGAMFACSNNKCTDPSDMCIASTVKELRSSDAMGRIPEAHSEKEKLALLAFLEEFRTVVLKPGQETYYTSKQYKLCEAIFGATLPDSAPYQVMDYIVKTHDALSA